MAKQTADLRNAITIVVLTSLSYAACQRSSGLPSTDLKPRASAVQVGEVAPDFTLEDQRNLKVTLSSTRGRTPSVLVFYRGYW